MSFFAFFCSLFRCGYCDVDYSVLGKVETLDDDLRFIVQEKGLQGLIPAEEVSGLRMNSVPHGGRRAERYFAQLTGSQKFRLLRLYQFDFELFGYSPDRYL